MADLDLGKLAEPLTKLVEVVGNGVGVWYEPRRIRRRAEAEADAALIAAKGRDAVSTFELRALERALFTGARRQRNVEAIIEGAVAALPAAVAPGEVDEDWAVAFFDQCQDVSNQQMQTVWSRLLAGEVAAPGSFSLRTLAAVRTLSRNDAELFSRFCTFVWWADQGPVPIVHPLSMEGLTEYGVGFADVLNLQGIGLVTHQALRPFGWEPNGARATLRYFERRHVVSDSKALVFGTHVLLTGVGAELASIAGGQPSEEYRAAVVAHWRSEGLQVDENPPVSPPTT